MYANVEAGQAYRNQVEKVTFAVAETIANEDAEVEKLLKDDDIQYVVVMALIVCDKPLRISNAVYKEIIPRVKWKA